MRSSLFDIDAFVSKVLNKKVAKLSIPEIKDIRNFKQLYKEELIDHKLEIVVGITNVFVENIKFFEDEKYKLISSKSLYCLEKEKDYVANFPSEFEVLTNDDYILDLSSSGVFELIEEIGKTSHYCKNLELGKNACRSIYKEWLKNTFDGYSEKVFVVLEKSEKKIVGILSLKKNQDKIFIDLLGVHSNCRRLGLASILLGKAIEWVKTLNEDLYVYTQGENISANRFYQKNGFIIKNFKLIYHKIF